MKQLLIKELFTLDSVRKHVNSINPSTLTSYLSPLTYTLSYSFGFLKLYKPEVACSQVESPS